jgi:hypothetical protein
MTIIICFLLYNFVCFDQSVRSVTLEIDEPLTNDIVDNYMQQLLWEKKAINPDGSVADIFRLKVNLFHYIFFLIY